jgi:sec-independent protein translocase protein TatC
MADADAVRDAGLPVRVTPAPDFPVGSAAPAPAAPSPAEPAPAAPTPAPGEMSLVGHLTELRDRIIKVLIAVALGSVVGFWFWRDIRNFLIAPLPTGSVQVLGPGDAFVIALRISVITGIILAMPVILYQVWAFVSPGLTAGERRTARPWVPLALLFFVIGVALAYAVLPFAAAFLLSFTDDVLVANLAAGPYFDFVTTMFLAFGLIMEFPIVLYGLSRVGIVTSQRLEQSRRIAILAIAVFSAGITPGGDLVSPLALGLTMALLYEGTIFMIRRSGK